MPKKCTRRKKNINKKEKVESATSNVNVCNISTPVRVLLQCSNNSSALKAAIKQQNLNSSTVDNSWDLSHLSDNHFNLIDSPLQITPSNLKAKKSRTRNVEGKNLSRMFCRSASILNRRIKSPRKNKSPMKTDVKDLIDKLDQISTENEPLLTSQSVFEEQDNLLVIDMEETIIKTNSGDDNRKSPFVIENDYSFIDGHSCTDLQFVENHSQNITKNNLFERDKLINTSPTKTLHNEVLCTDIIENPSTEEKCSESNKKQDSISCKSSPQKLLNCCEESNRTLENSLRDNASCNENGSENPLSESLADQTNSQDLITEDNSHRVLLDETKETEIEVQLINQDNSLKDSNINTSVEPDTTNLLERDQTIKNSSTKRPFDEEVITHTNKEQQSDEKSSKNNQNKLDDCELSHLNLPKNLTELDSAIQNPNQDSTSINKNNPNNSLNKTINTENDSQNLFDEHNNLQIIDVEENKIKNFGENKNKLQHINDDNDSFKETNSINESDNDSEKSDESCVKKCNAEVMSNSKTTEPINKVVCTDHASGNNNKQSNNCQKSLNSNDLNKSTLVKGYHNLRDRTENEKNLKDYSSKNRKQDNVENSSENYLSSSDQDYRNNSSESNKSDSCEMETSESECFSDIYKLEEPSPPVTIGEHTINTYELTTNAVKSWYPPSNVMRKMMSLETKLLINKSKFYEVLKNSNKRKIKCNKNNHVRVKKLLNNRWNEFCKLYKIDSEKPKYFYKNPITLHFFPNLFKYFNKFISQDLQPNVTDRSLQNYFRDLFEPVSFDYYSSYEDAIIMALRSRLKNSSVKEEMYLNFVACHALNRNVDSVSRRHRKLKQKQGITSQKKKTGVKRKKSSSSSETDYSQSDQDTDAENENRKRPLKGQYSGSESAEDVKEKTENMKSKNSINAGKIKSVENDINVDCEIGEDSNDTARDQSEKSFDKSSGFHQEETSADEQESNVTVCQNEISENNNETDEDSYDSVVDKSKKKSDKCGVDRKTNRSDEEENHADESGIDEDYNIINEGLSDNNQENNLINSGNHEENEEYRRTDEEERIKDRNGGEKNVGAGSSEDRISKISEKSRTWISILDAMLDVTGESRASAQNLVNVDLSVKDWRWISSQVSNTSQAIPAHIAKALYDSKLHPVMFASRCINNYKLILDIVYELKKRDYCSWFEVKWSEISKEINNLKPLFLFTTFIDFARFHVPLHLQSNIKECISYLLTEKLPFIKMKIKDGITLDGFN